MEALNDAWDRFWFAPFSTSTLAVVRIAFGFVVTCWTLALLPVLMSLFGDEGIIRKQLPLEDGMWGVLGWENADWAVIGLWVVLLLAAISLMVGFGTRIAAALVFVGLVSFHRRNALVINAGDNLLRITAFYLMLAPSGVALSVDRWRRAKERFWEFPERTQWALRLIQIQISLVYIGSVWAKVQGTTWNEGTATSYAGRIADLERFPVPSFIHESLMLSNVLTFATLAIELSLAILIWNRKLRPYVILLGIGLHLSIEYQMRVGFFALALFTCYLAFVPAERMDAVALKVRDWVAGRRSARAEREHADATGTHGGETPAPATAPN